MSARSSVVEANNKGPDQVVAATDLTTSKRNGAVALRREENGLGAEEPLSVPSLLRQTSRLHPHVTAVRAADVDGEWKEWNYQALLHEVEVVARALIESGLQRHHSVAILGGNSPQWVIAHLAAIFAGGIAAGVPEALGAEEIAKICLDCKADVIMVQQEVILKKVLLVQHKLPELKCIVQWEGEPPMSDKRRLARSHKKHILSWPGLLELGKGYPVPVGKDPLEERLTKVAINQCCSLVYATSNKGVMLSHDNLTWSAKMALGVIRAPGFNPTPSPGDEVMISFLPLAHISTQLIDIYYLISIAGTSVFLPTDILHNQEDFFAALEEVQPSVLYGPPVIFERIFHKLVTMRRSVSGLQKFFIDWSSHQVREKHGDCVTPDVERRVGVQSAIAKNTVCKKYKEALGVGPKTIFICRGGALPDRVLQFLSGFDIVVHPAYGQSECCSLLTANVPKRFCKFSSVGKPGPGLKVKLGEGGEVLATGRNLFMGYLNRENETKEVMTEDSEWLKTGDRAMTDDKGFLVLTCYPADLLTLFSGEEVEPSRLEDRVRRELGCVAHCLVVGQARENLAVLLSLDTEVEPGGVPTSRLTPQCQQWFRAARFEVKTIAEVLDAVDLGIKHVIQAGIDRTNLEAERASHFLTAWEILPQSFSLQTGELGQTGKVNRAFLADKLSRTINRMYTGEEWEEVPRKRSAEKFLVSHQLSNIVEDDEKSQRESQDKELLVHKEEEEEEIVRESEIEAEARRGVSRVKLSDKEESSKEKESESKEKKEEGDDSGEEASDTRVEITATIEPLPSKADQNTPFEANMEHLLEERGRRVSRT